MELIQVRTEMEKAREAMRSARSFIKERGVEKSRKSGLYDKAIAIKILTLKNSNKEMEFEGIKFNPSKIQANLLEKVAKGMCYIEKIEAEESEVLYKSLIEGMDSLKAELSSLQSELRYFE